MTLVSSPYTFQLDDGILLNTDPLPSTPFVDITRVGGLSSAPFRQTKRDHEGVDGGFMDAEFETGRDIVVEGTVYANNAASLEDFMDELKENYAPSTTLLPFYFMADNEVRLVFVKPLGVTYDWDTLRRTGTTNVTFSMYAEDPRLYSTDLNSIVLPIGATFFTGFGFNLAFSFGFGGVSTTSDGVQVTNLGNRNAPLLFTITGPVSNAQIIHTETGRLMQITGDVPSGHTLVIDTQYRTVRLDGTANRRTMLTIPGWFDLIPGPNEVRFRATAGSGTLTIQYRSAWR